MLGSLYIGDEFKPHITTLMDAFYFSIVCMTTLGFGDIVPISSNARMFYPNSGYFGDHCFYDFYCLCDGDFWLVVLAI